MRLDSQPAWKQRFPIQLPWFYTGHDMIGYWISLWLIWVSCPGCVLSQLPVKISSIPAKPKTDTKLHRTKCITDLNCCFRICRAEHQNKHYTLVGPYLILLNKNFIFTRKIAIFFWSCHIQRAKVFCKHFSLVPFSVTPSFWENWFIRDSVHPVERDCPWFSRHWNWVSSLYIS